MPPINVPGAPDLPVVYGDLYLLTAVALAVVYSGLRWLLATDFGRVVVAIRENEEARAAAGLRRPPAEARGLRDRRRDRRARGRAVRRLGART